MFHSFIELFSSQEKLSDKWVLLLIFLFPIAGPVVRHWNSSIFVLLSLTALYFFFTKKDRKPLYKEEKIYLWTFFLFFCVFLVSTISNGYNWEKIQAEGLGTEINFLLFIPIYLSIRENNSAKKALFSGILVGIPTIFLFSLYEYIYYNPILTVKGLTGAYSQLFLGPITALTLLMSYTTYKLWPSFNFRWIIPILILMGLFVVSFSSARTGYITLLFGSIILLLLQNKGIKYVLAGSTLILLAAISVYQIDSVKIRTNIVFDSLLELHNDDNLKDQAIYKHPSVGKRLEVWSSYQHIFKENAIVGIGNGNYPNFIQKYIKKGLVSSHVETMGHAHNTFFEVLITKGVAGLVLLLMIFYYPVYIAWKHRKHYRLQYITTCNFASIITLMSIGESFLINKNNGVSYLLVFSAVLFSSLINNKKIVLKH